jgi:hypothetical protein
MNLDDAGTVMSKRRGATKNNVLSWLKRGDGQGEGLNYKPFLHVRDVPSRGRSAMVEGLVTGRTHHYLSDIEYGYHVLAEYATNVIDIREQYALLPWEETQLIANSLGISHSVFPGTDTPIVMTSDIVLTIIGDTRTHLHALCIKPSSELDPNNPKFERTLEKLLIEKTYWQTRGVPWTLCTEKMLPTSRVRNLDLLRTTMVSREHDRLNSKLSEFTLLVKQLCTEHHSLNTLLSRISEHFNITVDEAFTLFGRSVWMRLLAVDLDASVIAHEFPVPIKFS